MLVSVGHESTLPYNLEGKLWLSCLSPLTSETQSKFLKTAVYNHTEINLLIHIEHQYINSEYSC